MHAVGRPAAAPSAKPLWQGPTRRGLCPRAPAAVVSVVGRAGRAARRVGVGGSRGEGRGRGGAGAPLVRSKRASRPPSLQRRPRSAEAPGAELEVRFRRRVGCTAAARSADYLFTAEHACCPPSRTGAAPDGNLPSPHSLPPAHMQVCAHTCFIIASDPPAFEVPKSASFGTPPCTPSSPRSHACMYAHASTSHPPTFEMPKSASTGTPPPSSRMFWLFRSRCSTRRPWM